MSPLFLFAALSALFVVTGCTPPDWPTAHNAQSSQPPTFSPVEKTHKISTPQTIIGSRPGAVWSPSCAPWDGAAFRVSWSDQNGVSHNLDIWDRITVPFSGKKTYVLGESRSGSGQFNEVINGVFQSIPRTRAQIWSDGQVVLGKITSGSRVWIFAAKPLSGGATQAMCG